MSTPAERVMHATMDVRFESERSGRNMVLTDAHWAIWKRREEFAAMSGETVTLEVLELLRGLRR